MMPGRTLRKSAPHAAPSAPGAGAAPDTLRAARCGRPCGEREVVEECALELRRIGDKWNLRQKILNLLTKLFCPET